MKIKLSSWPNFEDEIDSFLMIILEGREKASLYFVIFV